MPELTGFFSDTIWIAIGSVAGAVFFLWLALISGRGYSVEDTEAHSIEYGEVVKEGHGGMTAFLWVSFVLLFIWTIAYFVQHWDEFNALLAASRAY
jgi:hypothetical protein